MKSGLVALLTAHTGTSALVGSRVYVNNAPQKATFPHVIITQMSSEENPCVDGGTSDFRFVTFDIDCKAKTSLQAATLAKTIRRYLDDFSGPTGVSGESIDAVIMNSETDGMESPTDGSDVPVYVVTLDCDIQFHES